MQNIPSQPSRGSVQPKPQQGPRVATEVSTQNIPLRRPNLGAAAVSFIPSPQTPPDKTVPPGPGTTKLYSEENPNFMSIDLPSKFQFYDFKHVSACTLKGSHQAKLNRAYTQNRLRFVVEAMGATLEPGVSAFDLTPGDFYFLMYWQKVNSFTKSPQIITTQCTDPDHLLKVAKKELSKDSLKIEQFLNSTTLDTKYADEFDLPALRLGLEKYNLGAETMRDVVELTERLIDLSEAETEKEVEGEEPFPVPGQVDNSEEDVAEYGWLASRAAFLKQATNDGRILSLADRCKIVGDMSVEETDLLEKYMQAVTTYGVEEYATIKCKECSASKRVKISFDALTFLPNS